jgi:predicted NUDIX family NTP pyrophosphohydrolase
MVLPKSGAAELDMPAKTSAGLLLFRKTAVGIEVLLAHPGGPFFKNKDDGAWTIPKGMAEPGEELLDRARIEFEEELGIKPNGEAVALGSVRQKGGKIVHAWAMEGDVPRDFKARSNTFEMEWPPHSGKMQSFVEVDRAAFFPLEEAARKINPAQKDFLDRLEELIEEQNELS